MLGGLRSLLCGLIHGPGYICTTPPSMAAPFLHRWGGITMNAACFFVGQMN